MNILKFIKRWFTLPPQPNVPTEFKLNKVGQRVEQLADLGTRHGWMVIDWQDNIKMLSLWKEGNRINIYVTTMTVGTCLNHPRQGKTQLFRKNVTDKELEAIFINPRLHTNKGYHKRK